MDKLEKKAVEQKIETYESQIVSNHKEILSHKENIAKYTEKLNALKALIR